MVELTTNGYNFFRTALHVGAQTETMYLFTLEENRMMTVQQRRASQQQQFSSGLSLQMTLSQ